MLMSLYVAVSVVIAGIGAGLRIILAVLRKK